MENFEQVLLDRLVKKGADPSSLGSILRALSKILSEDPGVDPCAANERLRYLGWQEVQVDYHILQLALACFELQTGTGAPAFGEDRRARQALRLRNVEITPIAPSDL